MYVVVPIGGIIYGTKRKNNLGHLYALKAKSHSRSNKMAVSHRLLMVTKKLAPEPAFVLAA